MSGKLYMAVVYRQAGRLQVKCRCCRTDLSESDVMRKEDLGIRTLFIVACPKCGRFNEYWRNNRHGYN